MRTTLWVIWIITLITWDLRICLASERNLSAWLSAIKLPPCMKKSCPDDPYSGGIITFKDGQVDISAFVDRAKTLLQQSDYQNQKFFENLHGLFAMAVKGGCRTSMAGLPDHQIQLCEERAERSLDEAEVELRQAQAGRLLLPDAHYAIGDISSYRVKDAHEKLSLDCLSICSDQAVSSMLSHGNQEQYEKTVDRLSEIGPSCLKNALATLGREIQKANDIFNLPDSCEGETGRQRDICNRLKRDQELIIGRLSSLTDLVMSQSSSQAVESLGTCLESEPSFFVLGDFLEDLDKEMACSDYQPGEERDVSTDPWTHYRIKKETDGSYTASIAMTFSPADDYDNEKNVPKDQVNAHYRQRATDCLNQANPKMLGPNGERLNIVIADPQADSCLPQLDITIQSSTGRSNSGSYEADIDCPTTAHELLHEVGGLNDGYEEGSMGEYVNIETGEVIKVSSRYKEQPPQKEEFDFRPKYNCRVTQENSIMSNQKERWQKVFPYGESLRIGYAMPGLPSNAHIKPSDFSEYSLLDPVHFNAILYGNCANREDVQLYRTCAALARQTGYQGLTSNEDCPDLKNQCENQNVLGKSQEQIEKEHRVLNFQIRSTNALINRMSRNLITLEQAAIQTGDVNGQEFMCSSNEVDISFCKSELRWWIQYSRRRREKLMQQQQRISQVLSNTNTSNP